ncbi:MAG: ribulose-phosphate 3-epimerase [Coriobacteriales bacterium]|nr:ribulose-phosphate 3-epimerase [Coriobacteriales bacterium]
MAPSILSANFMHLAEHVATVADAADVLHVDVMDGHFVPNLTIGPLVVKALAREAALPLDVHLMVSNPEEVIDWYSCAGAHGVTVHIEACTHANRIIQRLHEQGISAGIAINPATPICMLRDVLCDADLICVMSVNPGFGGQKFISSTLRRLEELTALCKELNARPLIEVDGGVDTTTAPAIVKAGANMLVAGSAVFGKADPETAVIAIRSSCTDVK